METRIQTSQARRLAMDRQRQLRRRTLDDPSGQKPQGCDRLPAELSGDRPTTRTANHPNRRNTWEP